MPADFACPRFYTTFIEDLLQGAFTVRLCRTRYGTFLHDVFKDAVRRRFTGRFYGTFLEDVFTRRFYRTRWQAALSGLLNRTFLHDAGIKRS